MPGLAQRNEQLSNGASHSYSLATGIGFWSKHRDGIGFNQLRKFWNELSPQARQELLRIDKQALFEQARKNMYCSRCNGLLLEGFLQIVMYGKSLQLEGASGHISRTAASRNQSDDESSIVNGCEDEMQDPSVHPWGGLTTTREGSLTLMDCYMYSKSLAGLQNVFDSARARERERELLYPDACGGGGRGWISQGMVGYGRGHGTRETCALHTARLSCDTLVDFWSALGEETRQSLLRMKEEDFIERLMYRFDSKRFCRDCRRNVIREFKELKELKRMRREPRCTSWFCVADSAFQYEVTDDTVYADWRNTFSDAAATYRHFEWGVGTSEGKSDILDFENVGMEGIVNVDGLDLAGLSACFITLRAWKLDGRCTELSVKAHASKGGQCVHGRLVVGDGFVTITRGVSIRRFFEHAEEAEEEEDDDSMDKDGNDLDGECSRPQKHAKSPELAREFLLDAATVIFKEQVEKAFREGTARQNAHSIFVCLALKLLEERVHVACKEIITLEKQTKLLEEEEKEKREEEERRERRRTKEREKKLRRKERLKEKEKDKDKSSESSVVFDEKPNNSISDNVPCEAESPDTLDDEFSNGLTKPESQYSRNDYRDGDEDTRGGKFFMTHYSRRKPKTDTPIDDFTKLSERYKRDQQRLPSDDTETMKTVNSPTKQSKVNGTRSNARCGSKFGDKLHCSNNGRVNDRYDFHSCSCNQNTEYRAKVEPQVSSAKITRETKSATKSESVLDISKQFYHFRDGSARPKVKYALGNPSARDLQPKKVWEPLETQKNSALKVNRAECNGALAKPSPVLSEKIRIGSYKIDDDDTDSKTSTNSTDEKDTCNSKEGSDHPTDLTNSSSDPVVSLSSSDNCSSCLSEEGSSNPGTHDSSSSSDSEDSSLRSEGKEMSDSVQNNVSHPQRITTQKNPSATMAPPMNVPRASEKGFSAVNIASQYQSTIPPLHSQNVPFPVFQTPPTLGFYHQNPVSWHNPPNSGLLPFLHPNNYMYASPLEYGMYPMQHLASPMYAPGPLPFYQPVAKSNAVTPDEKTRAPKFSTDRIGDNFQSDNPCKNCKDDCDIGFSLFNYGGPFSTGQPKDEMVGGFSSLCSTESDQKEMPGEAYNLFAASNGLRFSFF